MAEWLVARTKGFPGVPGNTGKQGFVKDDCVLQTSENVCLPAGPLVLVMNDEDGPLPMSFTILISNMYSVSISSPVKTYDVLCDSTVTLDLMELVVL